MLGGKSVSAGGRGEPRPYDVLGAIGFGYEIVGRMAMRPYRQFAG